MQELIAILGHPYEGPVARQVLAPFFLAREGGNEIEVLEDEDYLSSRGSGMLLLVEDGYIHTFFLYGENRPGFVPYTRPLLKGLSFSMTHAQAEALLGKPSRRGGPFPDTQRGTWCRYDYPDYSLHLSFNFTTGCLDMVTLIDATVVPDRHPVPAFVAAS